MLLAILAVTTTLAEQPPERPALRIDTPGDAQLERVSIVQQLGIDHVRVALTFTIVVDDDLPHDVQLPIDVPVDTAVVGLRLALGDKISAATLDHAEGARAAYERIVERDRDPALLEWIDTTATHQRLRLRVFPVTAETPATVTIELVAPRTIVLQAATTFAQSVGTTARTRPMLGFGRQLGRKMSLIATDRDPNHTWNNVRF